MPKQATTVVLSEQEEQGLLQITKRHRSEQQVALRARIVLAAAQGPPMYGLPTNWASVWTPCACGEIAGQGYKGLTWRH